MEDKGMDGTGMEEKKMTMMGIGHKAGLFVGVYLLAAAAVNGLTKPLFRITEDGYKNLLIAGIILAIVGFSVNMAAALQMMNAFKNGKLATGGLYSIFLNPMYTMQLLVTLPGFALLFNSWMVLTVVPFALIVVKIFVREEEQYLEDKFGEQYRTYRKSVPIRII